jgi:ribosomal peptide maturation radical SAM protein 1
MDSAHFVQHLEVALSLTDVLIVVPPLANLDRPSLAAHLLQALARREGEEVGVLYANLLLARVIGVENYSAISRAPAYQMVGERLFARSAFGLPPLGEDAGQLASFAMIVGRVFDGERKGGVPFSEQLPLPLARLKEIEASIPAWLDNLAAEIAERRPKVVGCTTTFEQTAASVALLARLKRACPEITTIIGGANCEGVMADGIASLDPERQNIDYIFSGESESTFPAFLLAMRQGVLPQSHIVRGEPLMDLDQLPTPDFAEYFEQRARFLPGMEPPRASVVLPYETSRGCWWGQKHHCTFCGLNGETMAFRRKSPRRAIEELKQLVRQYPARQVAMTDNIMPYEYFRTVLPELAKDPLPLPIFYEQKSNLSLNDVLLLKKAGVTVIQPGIESLSSQSLQLMDKGVSGRRNLALLRYARSVGLDLHWNLLWGFPADEVEGYRQMLEMLPLLRHLEPPQGLCHITIDRFSPYFHSPTRYGISNLRPFGAYTTVLPKSADVENLAYHFIGDYESGCYQDLTTIERIAAEVGQWQARWEQPHRPRPALTLTCRRGRYQVIDTRDVYVARRLQEFDEETSVRLMSACSYERGGDSVLELAIERGLGVVLDGWYEPLMTAEPRLMKKFEQNTTAATGDSVLSQRSVFNILRHTAPPQPIPQPNGGHTTAIRERSTRGNDG